MKQIEEDVFIIEQEDIQSRFLPRPKESHKGTFGYVGIVGGCMQYTGAVKLASMSLSALRAGCGVVRIIIPESIVPLVAPQLVEQTIFPIQDEKSQMLLVEEQWKQALDKLSSLAIGMGWGDGKENERILEYLIKQGTIPMIIDADGLNTLSKMDLSILKKAKGRIIITPHKKEFSRLSKRPIPQEEKISIQEAKEFARQYQVIVLLKGATTIVTDGQVVYLVKRGCPGMATAGSGDVLSGILAGMVAYQEADIMTIAAGAYLAGVAGELAQEEMTDISMIASDTVRYLPKAIKEIRNKEE